MYTVYIVTCMDAVYFVCLGASAGKKDKYEESPLQVAEKVSPKESDPKEKKRYEKVHKDTHTFTHFDIANGCWQKTCTFKVLACQT